MTSQKHIQVWQSNSNEQMRCTSRNTAAIILHPQSLLDRLQKDLVFQQDMVFVVVKV